VNTSQGLPQLGLTGVLMLAAVIGLAYGCLYVATPVFETEVPLKPTLDQRPNVTALPMAVGVFYRPEFRAYVYEDASTRTGEALPFPLGRASVTLFERVFSVLFETALPVQSRPPLAAGGPNLAAVIEPGIEAFHYTKPGLRSGTYTAEIAYRFTVFSPQGEEVASWNVRGSGEKAGQVGFGFGRWMGEATDLAMQNAATKFLTGFRDVPEVRRWLRGAGIRGSTWIPWWLQAILQGG